MMTWLVKKALLEELKEFKMSITGSKNAMALMVMDETKKLLCGSLMSSQRFMIKRKL